MCGFLQDLQACADGPAFEPADRRACAGFRHTSMALPTGIEPLDTFRRGDTPTTHDRVKSYELWNYADRVMNGILMIKEVWRRSCGVWGWRVRTGSCYAMPCYADSANLQVKLFAGCGGS
jgi:hypothetical protein